MYAYKKKKLDILLCGNYDEDISQIKLLYNKDKNYFINKIKNNEPLSHAERLVYTEDILKQNKYNTLHFGLTSGKKINNVYHRVHSLMTKKVDLIIILLTNYGGALFEHAMVTMLNLGYKTINLIREDEKSKFTGMLLKGTFLMQETKIIHYNSDRELQEFIIRGVDTFRLDYSIREKAKKNIEERTKRKKLIQSFVDGVVDIFKP